jgi:hypothetical protein
LSAALFTRAGILETNHLQPLDKSRTVGNDLPLPFDGHDLITPST